MTVQEVKNKISQVQAGALGITVEYKSKLELTKAGQDVHSQVDCYAIKHRVGRNRVDWYKTKARAEMTATGHQETHQPPRGFRGPDDPADNGLFYVSIKSGEYNLILLQVNSSNAIYDIHYFIDGQEVDFADVESGVLSGDFKSSAIKKPEYRPFMLIPVSNIISITTKADRMTEGMLLEDDETADDIINEVTNSYNGNIKQYIESNRSKLYDIMNQNNNLSRADAIGVLKQYIDSII